MSPECAARLAAAMVAKRGPAATLRAIAPASLAIVTCDGRPHLYADAPGEDALRDRRQAWAMLQDVHRARRALRAAGAPTEAARGRDGAA